MRYVGSGEDAETGPAGWEFEVVVADRGGLTDRAPVTVALLDVNEAPAFADSAYAFELAENARGPRDLGRVEATAVDAGDVLTYGLASGDAARFEVDGTSGEVRYVGGGENYEDGPPRYALVVRVVDAGGLADEAGVVVTVLDVNEGPEAVGGIAPKVLEAYGAAAEEELGPYFRDPDGDALSYAAESSAPGVALAAVTESGRLSIAPQAIGVATVTVRATDPGGLEAMQQVQVTVEASTSERERALKLVRIQSADATELAGVTANAQRVRLAPELSGQWAVGGASVRTRVELGGRLDRGDAETGMGAEAGAELGFTHRASGFSVDARGRTLLVHQAEDFKEWNASVALRLQPGRDQGGLSFSLEPSWGAGGGGAGALWQTRGRLGPQAMGGPQAMAQDADAPGLTPARLAMELGWGAVLPGGGQIRPFGRWSREGTGGYRLNVGTQ